VLVSGVGMYHFWPQGERPTDPYEDLSVGLEQYDLGDFAGALTRFRRAAGKGVPEAQYHYGEMLFHGEGVQPDKTEGVRWVEKAAKSGHAFAEASMCLACQDPNLGPVDREAAERWAKLSSDQGEAAGTYQLALLSADPGRKEALLQDAARKGYAPAQWALVNFLGSRLKGSMLEDDAGGGMFVEGVRWARAAAEQGMREAQLMLGLMMEQRRPEEAHLWASIILHSKVKDRWPMSDDNLAKARTLWYRASKRLAPEVVRQDEQDAETYRPTLQHSYRHAH